MNWQESYWKIDSSKTGGELCTFKEEDKDFAMVLIMQAQYKSSQALGLGLINVGKSWVNAVKC